MLSFVTTATVSDNVLHGSDLWNASSNTISSDGTSNNNSLPGNFSIMNFANAGGFNSITFNLSHTGGTGSVGIGGLVGGIQPVPEPTTIALLGIGLVGLAGAEVRRRRKKKAVDKS